MAESTGARKVLVIGWMDADDIPNDVDFGWPREETPKEAPEKPAEPTAEQLRARQREAVTRAAAIVQKAAEELERLEQPDRVAVLYSFGCYDDSDTTGSGNPLANYFRNLITDRFEERADAAITPPGIYVSGQWVNIDQGPVFLRLTLPESVAAFARTLTASAW